MRQTCAVRPGGRRRQQVVWGAAGSRVGVSQGRRTETSGMYRDYIIRYRFCGNFSGTRQMYGLKARLECSDA